MRIFLIIKTSHVWPPDMSYMRQTNISEAISSSFTMTFLWINPDHLNFKARQHWSQLTRWDHFLNLKKNNKFSKKTYQSAGFASDRRRVDSTSFAPLRQPRVSHQHIETVWAAGRSTLHSGTSWLKGKSTKYSLNSMENFQFFFWKINDINAYTVSHRECGQFRPYVRDNYENFKIISTPTGSWIRSRRRRDQIQLPVGVEILIFHEHRDGTVHTRVAAEQLLCCSARLGSKFTSKVVLGSARFEIVLEKCSRT